MNEDVSMHTRATLALMLALFAGLCAPVRADDFDNPKARIPPRDNNNNRLSGGESFPPLPLPATPLRRTERKNEPAPPALVGKINLTSIDTAGGRGITAYPSVTLDIKNLMDWTNAQLQLRYR